MEIVVGVLIFEIVVITICTISLHITLRKIPKQYRFNPSEHGLREHKGDK